MIKHILTTKVLKIISKVILFHFCHDILFQKVKEKYIKSKIKLWRVIIIFINLYFNFD